MKPFGDFLTEKSRTVVDFGPDIDPTGEKDSIGSPQLSRAGFRKNDRNQIVRDSKEVEDKLNAATEQYGLNWLIGYIEPAPDIRDFPSYDVAARTKMRAQLDQWTKDATFLPPPNPQNTIVYVKPTSRVHTLTPHQMVHNIGHALWFNNPKHLHAFEGAIQRAIQTLQGNAYLPPGAPPPTQEECIIMMGRLVNLLSQQRSLIVTPQDLDNMGKLVNTGFNAWSECVNDLFPAFINAGGHLNLYPRGPGKIAKFDRTAAIPVNQTVVDRFKVREYVWKAMASDKTAWDKVSKILTDIIVDGLKHSTWAAQDGPVYAYANLNTAN